MEEKCTASFVYPTVYSWLDHMPTYVCARDGNEIAPSSRIMISLFVVLDLPVFS